jgi:hypothetical protein
MNTRALQGHGQEHDLRRIAADGLLGTACTTVAMRWLYCTLDSAVPRSLGHRFRCLA